MTVSINEYVQTFEHQGKNTMLFGPWGGQDGHHWDDGVYSTIRQLEIAHGSGVDSIRIEYDRNGSSVWSEKHGGRGGAKIDKIRLAYPDEYLTSLHGHYGSIQEWGPVFVRSLTFETNKRTYGPYGVEHGTQFSFPPTQGKIVGFLGKAGWYLDAIGVYLQPLYKPNAADSNLHFPHIVAHSNEKYEYSMIQGTLGPHYDLIVAVRHKDDKNNSLPFDFSQKTYHDHNYAGHNDGKKNSVQFDFSQKNHQEHHDHNYAEHKDGKKNSVQFDFSQKNHQEHNYAGHKDDKNSSLLLDHSHKTTTHDVYAEHKNQVIPSVVPSKIEKVPPKTGKGGVVTYGPWGGNGGSLFDDGVYDAIRQINLTRNVGIVSVRVCYEKNGECVWGSKNGGTGSFKHDKITFDYPSEILTHITGYHGPTMIMGPDVIKSLTFHTTKGKHGPYGEEQGHPFSTKLKEGSIVGFHGKKGLFLDAIGVYVLEGKVPSAPISHNHEAVLSSTHNNRKPASVSPTKANNQIVLSTNKADNSQWPFNMGKRGQNEEVVHRMVKDPAPFGPGPWGGEGGKPWDDGVYTGIKQIVLTKTDAICCIEIEYDRNGQSVWSVKHGGTGGQTANRVKLDYPHEVLTCVTGYYGPINKNQGTKAVQSLTFHSTRKKYGPFGEEIGTYFASGTTEGKLVGFHGRSSMYLDAIGVHMQHWLGNQKIAKPSLMKIFS
ncbi:hypothetical protein RD792_012304 [Penstemon davidsonii]|uniref:Jacalin-type lectin domain-containing protein n=1 Tax=Penstemon davidsonii TaxID=160366 RepID=A0ABR0CWG9_9LAMI|nr:hypothetical protein RD792_012304 [Penstemon davidsonii]